MPKHNGSQTRLACLLAYPRRSLHEGSRRARQPSASASASVFGFRFSVFGFRSTGGEGTTSSSDGQRYRASGLNLIVAAITFWNTVYLERAIAALRERGISIEDEALVLLSPIGWEHINLTGDYTWQAAGRVRKGSFRPLRPFTASNE
jgi:hypothetical protein